MIRTPTVLKSISAAVALVAISPPLAAQADDPPPSPAQSSPASVPPAPSTPPAARAEPDPTTSPEVEVYLKDGQRLGGLLVSLEERVLTLRIAGINTRLSLDEIQRYEILPPILERYRELRQSIGDDPDDLVRLAQWLQAREQYALALTEIQRALAADPSHADATRLKTVLEQQLVLRARSGGRSAASDRPDAAPAAANPERPRPGEFPLLSADDINLIKVYEIDLAARPRVIIPRETVERMLLTNAGHPLVPITREGRDAILRKSPVEILDLMFKLHAREFYRDVRVLDQPESIKNFRDHVARTWLMSCATNECHGGLEAGRLVLHNRNPNSEPTVYTNLLILDRFRTTLGASPRLGGVSTGRNRDAGATVRPLINWEQPERSPLLQAGLPREDSLFPHPVVPRSGPDGRPMPGAADMWKPAFRSTDDKLFRRAVDWMKSMYRPRPDYPIEYTPIRPFEPPPTPDQADPASPVKEPAPR